MGVWAEARLGEKRSATSTSTTKPSARGGRETRDRRGIEGGIRSFGAPSRRLRRARSDELPGRVDLPEGALLVSEAAAIFRDMTSSGQAGGALRDFLYLDSERVRSLLAQLDGGVVEQVVEAAKRSAQGRAGAKVFGVFDLRGTLVRERASEQTKTLQDAVYLLFEEAASESGLFASVDLEHPAAWEMGSVHEQLREAQLIRCTAPARILDSRLVRARTDRFLEWMKIAASLDPSVAAKLGQVAKNKRGKALDDLMREQLDGTSPDEIRRIAEFMELFLGGQILLRQFPCGPGHPAYALVGTLLDRAGYLQEERDALFAKYGSGVSEWTMVGQVATVPEPDKMEDPDFELFEGSEDKIDRTQFEEIGANLMHLMERIGIAEGPTYPAVPVTPLAVFREVPAGE